MDVITCDPETGEFVRVTVSECRFARKDYEDVVGCYAAADHSQFLENLTYQEMIEAGAEVDKPEDDEDFTLKLEQLVEWAPQFLIWNLGELAANDKDYFTLRMV